VIAHGAINGIAGISALLVQGTVNPILGPMPVGLIGSAGFSVVALALLLSPNAFNQPGTDGVVEAEVVA
jgi:hypothetical protein